MGINNFFSFYSDEIHLSEINILGSHDSATAFVAMEKLSRCQSLDISAQLKIGVRLLDIRLYRKGKDFFLCHALADCYTNKSKSKKLSFDDVFSVVTEFLKANPDETVIISLKQDRGIMSYRFFTGFYKKYIENNKDMWYLSNSNPILGQCRGKAVLMRRCKRPKNFLSEDICGLDFSFWEDQDGRKYNPLPVKLKEGLMATVQDRYGLSPEEKWHKCAKPLLDKIRTDNNNFAVHFLSTAYRKGTACPESNAEYINKEFLQYSLASKSGWILCDFVTEDIALKFNLKKIEV